MSDPFSKLSKILENSVEVKRGRQKDIQAKIRRIVRGAPEVMVKITGSTKSESHLKSHLEYISRNGDLEVENERGEQLKGLDDVKHIHHEWMEDQGKKKKNTRHSTNIVLSMPPGTDPHAVKDAARAFASSTFGDNHQYVFVLHTDEKHPHVHLTVKNLGFNGKRLHVKKGDPQIWRENFAEEVRKQGFDAEATSRAVRGVIMKEVKQAIKHIRSRGKQSETDKEKIKQVLHEAKLEQQGVALPDKPWEAKIKDRQTATRKAWLHTAKNLNNSSEKEDQKLSEDIAGFVLNMPALLTERHLMKKKIAASIEATTQKPTTGKTNNNDQDLEL